MYWEPTDDLESADAARERGREHRQTIRRSELGALVEANRDPVSILSEQNDTRLQDLIPLRSARMLTDPFAFYRGTAALMAADLAAGPSTDLEVIACGDAHASNFGLFATPLRRLVFDLNDFDEAGFAPFEWDVKRLVVSVVIGAEAAGASPDDAREAARGTAARYADALAEVMDLSRLDRQFLHVQPEEYTDRLPGESQRILERTMDRARKRTSERVARRLTDVDSDGRRRFVEDPPVLTHVSSSTRRKIRETFEHYVDSVNPDMALLLRQFTIRDIARRVVGVGSVGTRCYLVLMEGQRGEPLVLQVKEAQPTVLSTYGGRELPAVVRDRIAEEGEGFRVVALQRSMQSASDPFLGHTRMDGHDYYVRQFHDMKGSFDLESMSEDSFADYAHACATLLARAHAQSPSGDAVRGYVGKGNVFSETMADFAVMYAEKSRRDFDTVSAAVEEGRLPIMDLD